ncbi:dynein axonemal assembly factor 3 homolog [Dendroctonus ponderosae]|uniref:Dynein assembly factor 3, axonemal homolog n=1 Tax=Dendroctonus ponderosae TaxID=77166 RepID=U4U374_DENPD|nr:dynein axonemal assembly factor 3 homolog [Dendroctonus ponderosae]ERL86788.1 hypothetical protein D910_04194 [Dendroctonus ponderosae]KAH1003327.1 hypothetical protein HUJ05_011254 [Dendroctonus ponderosae]KAH1003328.1 hypothetical protein HUJ05_011254 [Dendroctonus ponderosae]
MFWGLTPAVDLCQMYLDCSAQLPAELNILLVGATDCRHVLQTVARRYRHQPLQLNFHLVEGCMETVARQLLILLTALQPQLGLDQKTRLLMELYGNTVLRPFSANYLVNAARDLLEMVADCDYLRRKIPMVSLGLKYRDRDYLENLLKFWAGPQEFNVLEMWDRRLRNCLATRYDSKVGVFDWDLHMRLRRVGAGQVCDQEYRSFRLHGLAFSWLESAMSRPNRSLVGGVMSNAHFGYLGDMETGPFIGYGLECEDAAFLKSTNGQNAFRSTDVTERNLKQILFEIEHQEPYRHINTDERQLGGTRLRQDTLIVDPRALEVTPNAPQPCLALPNVSVRFLPTSSLARMRHQDQYKQFFDLVYFAQNHLDHLDEELVGRVAKRLIVVEHQLFVVKHRKAQLEEYAQIIRTKIAGLDAQELPFDVEKDSYMRFVLGSE